MGSIPVGTTDKTLYALCVGRLRFLGERMGNDFVNVWRKQIKNPILETCENRICKGLFIATKPQFFTTTTIVTTTTNSITAPIIISSF